MAITKSDVVPVRTEHDIVLARQHVRKLTQELGFGLVDQTKMVTAASELARNTLVYGGGGEMRWEVLGDGVRRGLRLHFVDEGPGIPDLELALTDGWTSRHGHGARPVRRQAAGQRVRDRDRAGPRHPRHHHAVEVTPTPQVAVAVARTPARSARRAASRRGWPRASASTSAAAARWRSSRPNWRPTWPATHAAACC